MHKRGHIRMPSNRTPNTVWVLLHSCNWVCHNYNPYTRILRQNVVTGFSFGIGLTYPLAGFLIAHSGWRLVFYTTGTIGALWCVFWYWFAFDAPYKHPRITKEELHYIQTNIGSTVLGGQVRPDPNRSYNFILRFFWY